MLRFPAVAGQFYMASPEKLRQQVSTYIEAVTVKEEAIAAAIQDWSEPVLLIASSDMTHYEPHEIARQKDAQAIQEILDLKPARLHTTVRQDCISMCGCAPNHCCPVCFAGDGGLPGRADPLHNLGRSQRRL